MREETEFRPKPMVDIGGKPILWHIMRRYAAYGLRDFVLCLGYRGETIKEYFLRYHALGSDFTVDLAAGAVECHRPAAEDWRVTLVDTGLEAMTGARVERVRRVPRGRRALLRHVRRRPGGHRRRRPGRLPPPARPDRHGHGRLSAVPVRPARHRRAARHELLREAAPRGHAHQRRVLRLLARLPRPPAAPRRPDPGARAARGPGAHRRADDVRARRLVAVRRHRARRRRPARAVGGRRRALGAVPGPAAGGLTRGCSRTASASGTGSATRRSPRPGSATSAA